MTGRLCIALHDVAPATWPACARLLTMLDEIGATPVTLLVVPDFHGLGSIEHDAAFVASIDQRIRRGDEIALHGYTHRDDAASPKNPWQWFRRRVMTANEGEFSALDYADARQRIQRGLDVMSRLNWHVNGFVPPAWLASADTMKALTETPLCYTSTHTALIDLRGSSISAPCITASSRSSWRRLMSRLWIRAAALATRDASLVRVGLHPEDANHPAMMQAWRDVLMDLLDRRQAITKMSALASSSADARVAGLEVAGKAPSEI